MHKDNGLLGSAVSFEDLNITIDSKDLDYPLADHTYTMAGAQPTISIGSGIDTISLADFDYQWNTNIGTQIRPNGRMELQGDGADVIINGVSLSSTLKSLQDRLNLLVPNPQLESEWDQLRELGEQYRRLEAELAEKSQAWKALKQS